eukprot:765035-Hanusia_phi.AAC.11
MAFATYQHNPAFMRLRYTLPPSSSHAASTLLASVDAFSPGSHLATFGESRAARRVESHVSQEP